ncbi:MAG: hypothetical protein KC776_42110 [Myxococcales bacterium]|nr:hypothetical protein [Myxococcales bacterium]MCB9577409.1 hypothetical protein [Polyangiaceae bacterium]
MRWSTMGLWVGALTLAAMVGCGGSDLSSSGSGGAAGQGTGGGSGSGATGGSGAAGGTSPGVAKLVFQTNAAKSYCRTTDGCSTATSIVIKDATGAVLSRSPGWCYTPCDTCEPQPCPGAACLEQGEPVTGESVTWDGSYYPSNTCGSGSQCVDHLYAAPGKYTAVMCATPGALTQDHTAGVQVCTPSGPEECVEVPFDFPSADTFTGTLP